MSKEAKAKEPETPSLLLNGKPFQPRGKATFKALRLPRETYESLCSFMNLEPDRRGSGRDVASLIVGIVERLNAEGTVELFLKSVKEKAETKAEK